MKNITRYYSQAFLKRNELKKHLKKRNKNKPLCLIQLPNASEKKKRNC